MGKLRLALIAGGKSSEREVSLKSGTQVYQALNKDKYDVRRYDPLTDLGRLVQDAGELDAALVIMHGRGGEDGSLQGLLDLLEIPYQGSKVLASAVAMNKELSKALYQLAGLRAPAALAFIQTQKPFVDSAGQIHNWQPFTRFALNQDTGGAIRGPGRADLI